MDERKASGNCYEEIKIDVTFEPVQNTIKKIDEKRLKEVKEVMDEFHTLSLTITGYYGGGPNANLEGYSIETDTIISYDPKASGDYDPSKPGEGSYDGVNQRGGDLGILRAEAVKKKLNTTNPNVKCVAGKKAIKMFATFTLK